MSIGATLISAGVGLLTNNSNKKIAAQTAQNNTAIADKTLAQQQGQYNDLKSTAQAATSPFTTAGAAADVNGNNYHSSPGFNFAVAKGTQNVLGSQALNGLLRSGSAVKALDNYTVGAADGDFNNYLANQNAIASRGVSATGQELSALGDAAGGNAAALSGNLNAVTGANNQGASDAIAGNNQTGNIINGAAGGLLSDPSVNSFLKTLQSKFGQQPAASGAGGSSYSLPITGKTAYSI